MRLTLMTLAKVYQYTYITLIDRLSSTVTDTSGDAPQSFRFESLKLWSKKLLLKVYGRNWLRPYTCVVYIINLTIHFVLKVVAVHVRVYTWQ